MEFFFLFSRWCFKNPPHKLKTYRVSGTELRQATIAKSESWEVGIVSDFRPPKFFSELYFLLIVRCADPADRRCDRRTDGQKKLVLYVQSSTVPDTPYFSGQAKKKRKKKKREKMSGRSGVRIISDLCDSM